MAAHRWDPVCPTPRGLVRPVPLDPAGEDGPTKRQASGPHWRRTSQGLYVPASVSDQLPEQRILEQSVRLPRGGAVTGWAACRLWGGSFFDGLGRDGTTRLPVPLALGAGNIRGDRQVRLVREPLTSEEVMRRYGIPCCAVERAVFDAVRLAPDDREAVVVLDMAAAAVLTSVTRMRVYVGAHPRRRRIARARLALALASEHSRSPNETRLRLVWVLDAGLPADVLVNCPVHDKWGRLLGIADLLDPVAGLAVEFDGADHRGAGRHTRDVAKDEAFRDSGLEVARVTGLDLADRPHVVRRLLAAHARATSRPRGTWEARPPASTLDTLLDERDGRDRVHQELNAL
ncbi:hypothetical protein H5V45_13565 [Nocardioides sp. KIGAM211]|uniref:DUF559 domain-containing protein n=1 Tax=Nocardioides luti TaxID=2761101 RepID=A0A7X0VB11_9ACTN|nr:hypothetical protein [Nocardioides luti]MBB6628349.1 hypothetical protein [Nocardioides luti]